MTSPAGWQDHQGRSAAVGNVRLLDHAAFATQGRATYSMEFKHYSEAPKNVIDAIVTSKAK
jgi:hypothetical protein